MNGHILVVEDQEDNRQILRDLLGSAGYELTGAPAITLSRNDWHSSANGAVV
jgi:CheY-like chemotaxis protein